MNACIHWKNTGKKCFVTRYTGVLSERYWKQWRMLYASAAEEARTRITYTAL